MKRVVTTSGNQVVNVNQQINGGSWVSLGIFNLSGGDHNVVGVSRWTEDSQAIAYRGFHPPEEQVQARGPPQIIDR